MREMTGWLGVEENVEKRHAIMPAIMLNRAVCIRIRMRGISELHDKDGVNSVGLEQSVSYREVSRRKKGGKCF